MYIYILPLRSLDYGSHFPKLWVPLKEAIEYIMSSIGDEGFRVSQVPFWGSPIKDYSSLRSILRSPSLWNYHTNDQLYRYATDLSSQLSSMCVKQKVPKIGGSPDRPPFTLIFSGFPESDPSLSATLTCHKWPQHGA